MVLQLGDQPWWGVKPFPGVDLPDSDVIPLIEREKRRKYHPKAERTTGDALIGHN
jgi:hypothetical protein